jgi:hypothetical protein
LAVNCAAVAHVFEALRDRGKHPFQRHPPRQMAGPLARSAA